MTANQPSLNKYLCELNLDVNIRTYMYSRQILMELLLFR